MPLIKSASRAAVGENIKREMSAKKPRRQAIAIALDVQRRAKMAGGGRVATPSSSPMGDGVPAVRERWEGYRRYPEIFDALDRIPPGVKIRLRQQEPAIRFQNFDPVAGMAAGGGIDMPFAARAGAKALERSGMIRSPVAGRTDALPANVKSGSYVMPADVVSGLGQGNSMAGANGMNRLLKMGPYGAALPQVRAPGGMRMPTGGMMKGRRGFADGGSPDDMAGAPTDVVLAGGEFVIPVEKVAEIGGGDVTRGHDILDGMVAHIRKKTIKTLKRLPKPKKS